MDHQGTLISTFWFSCPNGLDSSPINSLLNLLLLSGFCIITGSNVAGGVLGCVWCASSSIPAQIFSPARGKWVEFCSNYISLSIFPTAFSLVSVTAKSEVLYISSHKHRIFIKKFVFTKGNISDPHNHQLILFTWFQTQWAFIKPYQTRWLIHTFELKR